MTIPRPPPKDLASFLMNLAMQWSEENFARKLRAKGGLRSDPELNVHLTRLVAWHRRIRRQKI
jgi:hypothetical protein